MDCFHHALARATYSAEKMRKTNLVDTASLFCDVYGLEPGQSQAGHRHAVGDKLYYVLSGTARIRVGGEERELTAGHLACARAGEEHGVRNPGPDRLALLVIMAPKPS